MISTSLMCGYSKLRILLYSSVFSLYYLNLAPNRTHSLMCSSLPLDKHLGTHAGFIKPPPQSYCFTDHKTNKTNKKVIISPIPWLNHTIWNTMELRFYLIWLKESFLSWHLQAQEYNVHTDFPVDSYPIYHSLPFPLTAKANVPWATPSFIRCPELSQE